MQEIRYPSGPAAAKGSRLHTACERYLKGEIPATALSVDFYFIRPLLEEMKAVGAVAEEKWFLRDTDWAYQVEEDEDSSLITIVDMHWKDNAILHIRDLKSGRKQADHYDQLELYALAGFVKFPEVKEVSVAPLYLEGLGDIVWYTRAMLPFLQERWKERWDKMNADTVFEATPGTDNCKWCPYKKSKGGQCEWDF